LFDFHGYPVTIVGGFPCLLFCHSCWYSMAILLPWLRYILTVEWRRNRGYHVRDRAEFRGVYGFRVYQCLIEFIRVTQLTATHKTREFNPEYTRVKTARFGVNKLRRVTRLFPCWRRFTVG
jgi:hypothetical protein